MNKTITVVGGGLAGCEAAWQAAEAGTHVLLYEMRPKKKTPAHSSGDLAELVCSNSLGSALPDRATGLLQNELRRLGSLLLSCADATRVPAGGALAVDREAFAQRVTQQIEAHPRIEIRREEVTDIPDAPTVIASGPLTSDALSESLAERTGRDHLAFFDALSPIVRVESIDMNLAFRASRYERGEREEGDYINCPLNREEYAAFVKALIDAERIPLRSFEQAIDTGVKAGRFFEGCLPIEILARRGHDAMAFGPMRPVGLDDPRTGRWPAAILQLRQDNLAGSLYNLVGFQTNLKHGEQDRVFRMIPGLVDAEFVRYGQMHRNTFLASPALLDSSLQLRTTPGLFFAGQLTGVEGYVGNIGTGLLAGRHAVAHTEGTTPTPPPRTTMLGALLHYITHAELDSFQPMKANFGIMPSLEPGPKRNKRQRAAAYAERSLSELEGWLSKNLQH